MRTTRKILVGALAALGLATAAAMTYADAPGALGQLAMGPGMGGSAGVMGPGMMGFGGGPRGGYGPGAMGPQNEARGGYGPGTMGPQGETRGYGPGRIGPQGETRGYGPGMQGGQRGPGTGNRGQNRFSDSAR